MTVDLVCCHVRIICPSNGLGISTLASLAGSIPHESLPRFAWVVYPQYSVKFTYFFFPTSSRYRHLVFCTGTDPWLGRVVHNYFVVVVHNFFLEMSENILHLPRGLLHYSFVAVMHNCSVYPKNRFPFVCGPSALFHRDSIAQFFNGSL